MIMERLDTLFRHLEVRDASPEKFLESDLGLDFQERLCIREDIEESLHVVISDDDIAPDLTMLDLAGLLSRKLLVTPGQENFEAKLVEDIAILAPPDVVRKALLDVTAWPDLLPFVHDVRLIYDDGLFQEFEAELDGGNGNTVSVRSVRRCEPDHISYFQPQPAGFLKHHCGDWFIRPLAENATHFTVVQRWTRSVKANSMFPPRGELTSAQQVARLLRDQARSALAAWKRSLEHRGPCVMRKAGT
jgi:hypothetical protein